jgi:hypothetical protein
MTNTNTTNKIKETKQAPTQLSSHPCEQCHMTFARDSDLQRHTQKHNVEVHDKLPRSCTNIKASTIAMLEDIPSSPRSHPTQREKPPQFPHQRPNQVSASTHKLEPTIVLQPSSQIHLPAQASLSQSTTTPEDYPMKDDESSHANKVKKQKQKSNQQGSHRCEPCDITFTRHFDLLRHNQKHQAETEEDMAR